MNKKINYIKFNELNKEDRKKLLFRTESDLGYYFKKALPIIKKVKDEKDQALFKLCKDLDGLKIELKSLKVSEYEIKEAFDLIEPEMKNVIEFCSENVKKFHEKQMPKKKWFIEMHEGVMAGEIINPIESVAIYVPMGKGAFPSVAMMASIPAVIAGVKYPIILTPPKENGKIDSATLVAASIAGVSNIFKCGGVQAIAAAAYGTQSIPKCLKVVGPGSPWISAAKTLLSGEIDTGSPAGPSEAIILADESANGKIAALDLLIEAEHGSDSSAFLITNSEKVALDALNEIPNLWKKMSANRVLCSSDVLSGPSGGIILMNDIKDAIEFTNEYAPEHLQILSDNPDIYLDEIKNAGEILLGEYSPLSIANFSLGPNNVIPTNGASKTRSPLSVHDFLKSTSIGKINKKGYKKLAPYTNLFAKYEGFDAHANAVSDLRIKAIKNI